MYSSIKSLRRAQSKCPLAACLAGARGLLCVWRGRRNVAQQWLKSSSMAKRKRKWPYLYLFFLYVCFASAHSLNNMSNRKSCVRHGAGCWPAFARGRSEGPARNLAEARSAKSKINGIIWRVEAAFEKLRPRVSLAWWHRQPLSVAY